MFGRNVMVKTIAAFLFLIFFFPVKSASPEDLGNDSAGQILYAPHSGKFYVFRGISPDGRKWICTPHGDMKKLTLSPAKLKILDIYETDDPYVFGLYALEAVYTGRNTYFWKLAKRHGGQGNRVRLIQEYLRRERLFREEISREQNKMNRARYQLSRLNSFYVRNNKQKVKEHKEKVEELKDTIEDLKDKLRDKLLNNNLCQLIENIRDRHDHFTAFVLFTRYRLLMHQMPHYGEENIKGALRRHLRSAENNLYKAFNADRQLSSQMTEDFRKVCPGMLGKWSELSPDSISGLERLLKGAFDSFHKSRNYSPRFEFPQWGNAVLDMIVLAPDDPDIKTLKDKFNASLRRYRTRK